MINFTPGEIEALTKAPEMPPLPDGAHIVTIQSAKEGVSKDNSRKLVDLTLKTKSNRVIFAKVFTDAEELRMKILIQVDGEPTEEQQKKLELYTKDAKKLRDLISATNLGNVIVSKGGLDLGDLLGKELSVFVKTNQFNGKSYQNVLSFNKIKVAPKPNPAIEE